jgi:hypothetical protein
MTKTKVQQFSFITTLFSDTCRHTKNKSRRRCRLYFRGRMHCWWIFDFETNYINGDHFVINCNNFFFIIFYGYIDTFLVYFHSSARTIFCLHLILRK